jgi:deoxycytidylate deaminase
VTDILFWRRGEMEAVLAVENVQYYLRFEVLTAVIMKKAIFWDVAPCRYCLTDVSEERIASIFWVEEKKRESSSEEPASRIFLFSLIP